MIGFGNEKTDKKSFRLIAMQNKLGRNFYLIAKVILKRFRHQKMEIQPLERILSPKKNIEFFGVRIFPSILA